MYENNSPVFGCCLILLSFLILVASSSLLLASSVLSSLKRVQQKKKSEEVSCDPCNCFNCEQTFIHALVEVEGAEERRNWLIHTHYCYTNCQCMLCLERAANNLLKRIAYLKTLDGSGKPVKVEK